LGQFAFYIIASAIQHLNIQSDKGLTLFAIAYHKIFIF